MLPYAPSPASAVIDDDYDSAADSDFDPSASAASAASAGDVSSDDGSDASSTSRPKSRTTIECKGKKRRRGSANPYAAIDEAGGNGGLIKTRRQRAKEQAEKRGGVTEGGVTTDVEKLWAEMKATPIRKATSASPAASIPTAAENGEETKRGVGALDEKGKEESAWKGVGKTGTETEQESKKLGEEPGEIVLSETGEKMVRIKTSYKFAGEKITEEKLVPLSSSSYAAHASFATSSDANKPSRPPPRKKRASIFDAAALARAPQKAEKPAKINTLEKSRLDWASFVDKEGIGDELQKWNKGDKGYLDRQEFLGRVEGKRDEMLKDARRK